MRRSAERIRHMHRSSWSEWKRNALLRSAVDLRCPGQAWPGRGGHQPTPSSAQVKERVKLYLYSPSTPSWQFTGWIHLYFRAGLSDRLWWKRTQVSFFRGTLLVVWIVSWGMFAVPRRHTSHCYGPLILGIIIPLCRLNQSSSMRTE